MTMKTNAEKGGIDRLMDVITNRLAPVMGTFSENKTIQSIVQGMVGAVPVTFVGAIFLLLVIVGSYVPAIGQYTVALLNGFYLTLNLIGFYVAMSVGIAYARIFKLNQLTAAVISAGAFLTINVQVDLAASSISIANFGSTGIFPALIVTLLSMWFYRLTVEKGWTIKMPAGVPPMIGDMFAALIPAIVVILITWFVRNVLLFDLATWLSQLLAPIFTGVDNVYVFTLRFVLGMLFWSVGIHGDAMLLGVITPFLTTWSTANAAAAAAGQPIPYIWTQTMERMVEWVPAVWGLMFWMFLSKVKAHRALAIASLPAAVFTIVEPIVFGLPIAFNAYLLIPFVLSTTVASVFSYLGTQLGLFSRFFVDLPWFMPPPISAVAASGGDWANLIMVVANFLIGVIIYWPFYKAFEKKELEKEIQAAKAA